MASTGKQYQFDPYLRTWTDVTGVYSDGDFEQLDIEKLAKSPTVTPIELVESRYKANLNQTVLCENALSRQQYLFTRKQILEFGFSWEAVLNCLGGRAKTHAGMRFIKILNK